MSFSHNYVASLAKWFSLTELDLNVLRMYFEAMTYAPWPSELEREREAGSLFGAQEVDVTGQVGEERAEKS